jgi:hypothetical protein
VVGRRRRREREEERKRGRIEGLRLKGAMAAICKESVDAIII